MADAISEVLPKDAADVFVDRSGIHGSEDFVSRITAEIGRSDLILFIASRNSCSSRYVKKELIYAMNKGIPVLPYLVENNSLPDAIAFLLGDINQLSMEDHPVNADLGREILLATDRGRTAIRDAADCRRKKNSRGKMSALFLSAAIVFGGCLAGMWVKRASEKGGHTDNLMRQTLLHASETFCQLDSLQALNEPEQTGEREITLLLNLSSEMDRLDSLARTAGMPVTALPESLAPVRREVGHRLDSMGRVWMKQAEISLSLYDITHLEQELAFTKIYLDLAGKINRNAEWKELYERLRYRCP